MRTISADASIASTVESISKWVGRRQVRSTICWYGMTPLMIPDDCPIFVYEAYKYR